MLSEICRRLLMWQIFIKCCTSHATFWSMTTYKLVMVVHEILWSNDAIVMLVCIRALGNVSQRWNHLMTYFPESMCCVLHSMSQRLKWDIQGEKKWIQVSRMPEEFSVRVDQSGTCPGTWGIMFHIDFIYLWVSRFLINHYPRQEVRGGSSHAQGEEDSRTLGQLP